MSIIDINNISKIYEDGTKALTDVSLSIEKGKFTAIMGPSGSGKSTLMNIIGLMDNSTEGSVYIDGIETQKLSQKEAAHMRMSTIGFVFQDFLLNPYLSARDNVVMPMKINPKLKGENLEEKAERLLERFGIGQCSNKLPSAMSGGEKQRVAIARAFANDPQIILADEPTGNLDEENERNIFECLKELSDGGKTVVVISHNEAVLDYADEILYIKKGKIYEQAYA